LKSAMRRPEMEGLDILGDTRLMISKNGYK
jgi:hypothetical protein